jgi:hypothetical protein
MFHDLIIFICCCCSCYYYYIIIILYYKWNKRVVRDDEWAKYVEVVEKKENAKKGQLELDTINIYYSTSTNLCII